MNLKEAVRPSPAGFVNAVSVKEMFPLPRSSSLMIDKASSLTAVRDGCSKGSSTERSANVNGGDVDI